MVFHFDPAPLSPPSLRGNYINESAEIADLLDLLPELIEGPNPFGDDLPQVLPTMPDTAAQAPGVISDDIGREVRQGTVGIAPVEGLVHPPDDLDVLLRHRPRSIAREGAAFRAEEASAPQSFGMTPFACSGSERLVTPRSRPSQVRTK